MGRLEDARGDRGDLWHRAGDRAALSPEGARVLLANRDASGVRQAADEIGGEAVLDVLDEGAIARVEQNRGALGILVNAAGVTSSGTVLSTSSEELNRRIGINPPGTFLTCTDFLPLLERARGSIVNVASNTAFVAIPRRAAYCPSKGGCWRSPGRSPSTTWRAGFAATRSARARSIPRSSSGSLREYAARQPMQRMGTPEGMAAAALFLASDETSFITGAVLLADGGWTAIERSAATRPGWGPGGKRGKQTGLGAVSGPDVLTAIRRLLRLRQRRQLASARPA